MEFDHNKDYLDKLRSMRESDAGEKLSEFHKDLIFMSGKGGMLKSIEEDNLRSEKFLDHRMNQEEGKELDL